MKLSFHLAVFLTIFSNAAKASEGPQTSGIHANNAGKNRNESQVVSVINPLETEFSPLDHFPVARLPVAFELDIPLDLLKMAPPEDRPSGEILYGRVNKGYQSSLEESVKRFVVKEEGLRHFEILEQLRKNHLLEKQSGKSFDCNGKSILQTFLQENNKAKVILHCEFFDRLQMVRPKGLSEPLQRLMNLNPKEIPCPVQSSVSPFLKTYKGSGKAFSSGPTFVISQTALSQLTTHFEISSSLLTKCTGTCDIQDKQLTSLNCSFKTPQQGVSDFIYFASATPAAEKIGSQVTRTMKLIMDVPENKQRKWEITNTVEFEYFPKSKSSDSSRDIKRASHTSTILTVNTGVNPFFSNAGTFGQLNFEQSWQLSKHSGLKQRLWRLDIEGPEQKGKTKLLSKRDAVHLSSFYFGETGSPTFPIQLSRAQTETVDPDGVALGPGDSHIGAIQGAFRDLQRPMRVWSYSKNGKALSTSSQNDARDALETISRYPEVLEIQVDIDENVIPARPDLWTTLYDSETAEPRSLSANDTIWNVPYREVIGSSYPFPRLPDLSRGSR